MKGLFRILLLSRRPTRQESDQPLVRNTICGRDSAYDAIVCLPSHPFGFFGVVIRSRRGAKPDAQFTGPTQSAVVYRLALRGIGQTIDSPGPEMTATKRQMQNPRLSTRTRALKPPTHSA